MSSPLLIPFRPNNQRLQVTLAGTLYQLTVRWNDMNQAWTLDLADSTGNPVISGIPMVTGQDLLAPFKYLRIGGQLIVQTTDDPDAVPTLANLGSTGNLYFIPN